jgi:lysyl-tRNA synthetase, class II
MENQNNGKNTKITEREERIARLETMYERKMIPFKDKFGKKDSCEDLDKKKIGSVAKTAGRVMLLRKMGKITFAHIQDFTGKFQIVFKVGDIKEEEFNNLMDVLDVGDFIGVDGKIGKTKTGEKSLFVKNFVFLSKAIRPMPEKWHGVKDTEIKYRKRYLDLLTNEETREVFKFRSDFIWEIRNFYHENGFSEIDTPVLCNTASGALARPFQTKHNALDMDVYLRIAPELFLKKAIVGGYEKVFEVARCFRNEGIDPSHLQDFTMIEHYCAYWDFNQNMKFTEDMLIRVIKKLKKTTTLPILDRNGEEQIIDFKPPWPKVSFRELLIKDCGIDIDKFLTAEELRKEIKKNNIEIDDINDLGRGNMIDSLYKKVSRKKIINPTFLINHPIDLSPLARRNDLNPLIVDRFQLVINGWEVVNAYSELIDPIDQEKRFDEQMEAKKEGDEEAMAKDNDYLESMEYGMPPISGWGMGVERIVALLMKKNNLKDVVLFPLLKPEE